MFKRKLFVAAMTVSPLIVTAVANPWPEKVREIEYKSSADGSMQKAMFYAPQGKKKLPLVVALHTWSADYTQPNTVPAKWAIKKDWVFIHPNFRGPNWTLQGMGSELAVQDIIDAVEYAKSQADIDTDRIYLIGGSGGGYATLLMAGRAPQIWAACSAWCPISDLKKWHDECRKAKRGYYEHIEKSAGGNPQKDQKAADECVKRSANTYLANAKDIPVDISTGIHDGHSGSVPVSHALEAFNVLANPADRISDEDIKYFVEKEAVPPHLAMKEKEIIPTTGKVIHFRRVSGNVRVTIFEGGHDILPNPGLNWLEQQKKGQAPNWDTKINTKIKVSTSDTKVGK
ncbi:MAG: hypothetical protein A2020_04235 [Lentisphaerae bacterium GWF2_45_14]|nr:MAG: hypothetical protein A2020_04235 [Lentisphaerae bacterium GWF2_45_14]